MNNECTLALIKPDALRRGLLGRIIEVIESNDFTIVHMQSLHMTLVQAQLFYGRQHQGRPYFEELTEFMSSGMCVGLILAHAETEPISAWRQLMGAAQPEKRLPSEIRHRFGFNGARMCENLVHGSDSIESFEHEIEALGWRNRR
jgi:nucleoside-diphosphate kinase